MRKMILLLLALLFQITPLKANTVVLIHGFLLSGYHMKPLEMHLRGSFPIAFFEFPSRKEYIDQTALRLVNYLRCLASYRPGEPIYFVAHSVGGIILRAALNHPECPVEAKVGRAVLLGPPNQGSIFARYFKNWPPIRFVIGEKSGYELMHYCPDTVASVFGEYPSTLQLLIVAGCRGTCLVFGNEPNDGYVTIEETRTSAPHLHTVFPISHGDLIHDREVACLTKRFLLYGY